MHNFVDMCDLTMTYINYVTLLVQFHIYKHSKHDITHTYIYTYKMLSEKDSFAIYICIPKESVVTRTGMDVTFPKTLVAWH